MPVKIRPAEERAAEAQVWSVRERFVEKRGMAFITASAVGIKESSRAVSGCGMAACDVWKVGRWV